MMLLRALLVFALLIGGANAQMNSYFPGPGMAHSTAPATTTLDPTNIAPTINLSLGNLTATGASFTNGIARSITSHAAGKYYAEFTVTNDNGNATFGITNTGHTLIDFMGNGGTAAVNYAPGTGWLGTVSGTTTADPIVVGHTYGLAVDVGNATAWVKDLTIPGNWNANVSADPATNTNGCSFSAVTGSIIAALSVNDTGNSITVNFGATAYVGTPPAGFGNW